MRRPRLSPTQAATLLWLSRAGLATTDEIREGVDGRSAINGLLRRGLIGVDVRRRRGVRPTAFYYATERGRNVAARLRETAAATARAEP